MSDFTCRNGHAVSIKDKFCHTCGLPIKHEDGKPRTYQEYMREFNRENRKQIRSMESRLNLGER